MVVKLNSQNFRYFFINDLRHRAVGAVTHIGIPVGHHAIGRAEGIVCSVQHGNVIQGITDADKELFAQFFLQVQSGAAFGNTHGLYIQDPGTGKGGFHDAGIFFKDVIVGAPEDLAEMDRAEAMLREKYGHKAEVVRAAPRIIDIQAKGVSKARSARELQQRLGRKILVCVGDGKNDISMLSEADYAYSPADAIVANLFENVCDCARGAVADVIYEKIPAILKK